MDQPPSQFISRRWERSRPPSFSLAICCYRHPPGCRAGGRGSLAHPAPAPAPTLLCGSRSQSPSTPLSSLGLCAFWRVCKGSCPSQSLSCNTSAFSPLIISPVEENNINMCLRVRIYFRSLCVIFPYSEAVLGSFYSSSTANKRIKYCYL